MIGPFILLISAISLITQVIIDHFSYKESVKILAFLVFTTQISQIDKLFNFIINDLQLIILIVNIMIWVYYYKKSKK